METGALELRKMSPRERRLHRREMARKYVKPRLTWKCVVGHIYMLTGFGAYVGMMVGARALGL